MTDNSVLDLEQQINLLADAALAASDEVDVGLFTLVEHDNPRRVSRNRPLVLVAAASLVAILGFFLLWSSDEQGFDVASPASFSLTDPLDIDLADAIALSDQRRLASIGPQLTVDFDQLPEGWEAETFTLGTTGDWHPFAPDGASYWHQFEITRPDGPGVVVNIVGSMEPGVEPRLPDKVVPAREAIQVRGQPGSRSLGSVDWVEQGRIRVDIARRTGLVNDFDSEILAITEALVFTEQYLDWYQDPRLNRGSGLSLADLDPYLAGQLPGVEWRIVVPKEDAILIVEPSFRDAGGLPYTEPATYEDVNVSVSSFHGGVLVWGNTPPEVKQVRLVSQNSSVLLPTAAFGPDRSLFAVPIDDQLDPVALELLDDESNLIGSFELAHLTPHSIGAGIGPYTPQEISPDGD